MYTETFSGDEYVDSVGEERAELSAYDAADTRYMGVANGQVFQLCALQRAAAGERAGAIVITTSVTSDMEDTLRHTMLPTSSPSPRGVELATTTYSSDINNNNNNNSIDLYSEQLSHTLGLHHNASVLSFRSPVMASAEARRVMRGRSASVANSPSMATRLAWQDSFFRGAAAAEEGDEASSASTTNEMDSSADGLHMCHASSCIDCTTTPRPYSASELDHASFMTPTRRATSTEANGMATGLCSPDQFFLSYVPHAAQTQHTSDSQSAHVTAHTPARALPYYASGSSPVLSDGSAPHTTNTNAEGSNSNTTQHAGAEAHRPVLHLGSRGASSGGRHGSQGYYTTPIAPPHQHSPSRRDASPQLRPPQRLSLPPSATVTTQHTRYYSFCSYGAGAATNTTGTSSSYNGMTAELCTPVRHGESELLWSSASPQRPRSQTRSSLSTVNSPGYHTTGSMPRPFSVSGQSASQGRPPLRRPSLPAQSAVTSNGNTAHVIALRSPQPHMSQHHNDTESNANTVEGASAPPPVLYERVLNAPGMAVQENMSLIHWGCAGLLVVLDSGVYLRQDTPSVHCVFVNTAARRTTRVSCVVSSRTPLHCCPRANYQQSMNIDAGATHVEEMVEESGEMLYMVFGLNTGTVLVHEYRAEPVASTQHTLQEGHLVQNDAMGFVWCAQAMQRRFMRRTGIATLHCDVGCESTAAITSMHLAGHTLYVGGMRGVLLVYDLQRCVFVPTTHGINSSHSSNGGVRNGVVDTASSALHARTHSFPSTIFPRHHFLTGLQAATTTTTIMTKAVKEPTNITNNEGSNTLAPPALRGLCVGSPIFHIAVTEDRNHIALGTQDGLLIYHEGQLQVHHYPTTTSSDTRIVECGDATYFVRATRPAADTPSEPQVVLRGTMTPVRAFDWLYRPTVPYNSAQRISMDECHTLHDTPHGSIARTGATRASHSGIEYSQAGTVPLMTGMWSAVLVYGHECELGVYVLGTGRTVVRRTLPRAIHAIVCSRTSNEIIACTEMSADELGHYRVQRRPATPLVGQSTPSPVQQQSTSASYYAAWTQLRRAMTHQSTTSFSSSSWSSTPSASPAQGATTAASPAGRAVAPAMPILALRPTASPSRPAAMGHITTTSVAQQPFTQVLPQGRGPLYLLELQLSEEGVSDHTFDMGTMQEGDFNSSMRKGPVLRLKGCYGSETRSAVVYTALSPDGTQLATAGPEEMVRFWRLALRKQKAVDPTTSTEATLPHTGPLRHWRYLTGVLSSSECGTASVLDLSPSSAITPLMVSEALR